MKILYVHNADISSKKANLIQVLSMCNSFKKNKIDIKLVLPEPFDLIKNINDFIKNKFGVEIKFKILFYKRRFKNSRLQKYLGYKSIKNLLLNDSSEFVFVRTPYFINTIIKCNKKVIFESHNNLLHNRISIVDKYLKRGLIKFSKNNKLVLFISISQNLSDYWLKLSIPSSKLISLHDGFSGSLFNEIKNKNIVRKKLNIPLNKKIIMYVGSLYPDREIENILNLSIEFPHLLFYIVGGPDKNKDYYLDKAKQMNIKNICFTGYVSHKLVSDYLYSSDILLALWSKKVPTINYCSPLKIFEYMASEKIIIAHNFITIREVLKDKDNAFLVEPNNHSELVLALDTALKEKSNRLGVKARREVYANYTWDLRAKKIINLLKNA